VTDRLRGKAANVGDEAACMIQFFSKHYRLFKQERQMMITMQRELVSILMDLFYKMRIAFHALSDQKECRPDVVPCKRLQYARRIPRMRSIVKGQGDLAAGAIPKI